MDIFSSLLRVKKRLPPLPPQAYIVIVSGSILNVSTVHLNGI